MSEVKDEIISVRVGDWIYEIEALCPHRAGRLKYGYVNHVRKTITCPLHRSVFSLETGKQLSGPQCSQLKIYKKQEDGVC